MGFRLFGYPGAPSLKELFFISYAGAIRGAVALGCVLRIDDSVENRSVIATTSFLLVVFTTIVLGSTTSTLSKLMFSEEVAEARRQNAARKHGGDAHVGPDQFGKDENMTVTFDEGYIKQPPGCFVRFIKNFDVKWMKPNLIYDFHNHYQVQKQKQLQEARKGGLHQPMMDHHKHTPGSESQPLNSHNQKYGIEMKNVSES